MDPKIEEKPDTYADRERKEAQERLMSSIPTEIGDEDETQSVTSAEIHSPDFSAQAARPRLGTGVGGKPFVFPIIKQNMSLSDAMSYLVNLEATKGTLLFWTEESPEPIFVNFGDLTRAEMVYALERTKSEEILASFSVEEDAND